MDEWMNAWMHECMSAWMHKIFEYFPENPSLTCPVAGSLTSEGGRCWRTAAGLNKDDNIDIIETDMCCCCLPMFH